MAARLTRLTGLWRNEDGQSLVEASLLSMLVLLPLVGGVVYCGGMVITQENLAVSARHVARRAALSSLDAALTKKGGVMAPATATVREQALAETAYGKSGTEVKGVNWNAVNGRGPGNLRRIDAYTAQLELTATLRAETLDKDPKYASSHQMGLGVVYHGATVSKSYTDLAPMGRLAYIDALTPSVSATSVMPSELAPVGKGANGVKGILNLNGWITDIVNEKTPVQP